MLLMLLPIIPVMPVFLKITITVAYQNVQQNEIVERGFLTEGVLTG